MINRLPYALETILHCTLNIKFTQTGKNTVQKLINSIGILIFILLYCQCPLIAQGAGKALSFDGSDDYVDLTVGDYVTDSEGAFEAWIKPVCAGEEGRIITITDKSEGSDYNYFSESGCKVVFRIREAGSDFVYATTANQVLSADSWSHIVYQQNGSGIQLFVDGIQITNFTVSGGSLTTTAWNDDVLGADGATIGVWEKDAGKINYFEGTIDEVRIWNVARTQTQIRDWMHKTEGLTDETGLVSVWHLDEGSGTSTDDPKGNNDGTINGATWISSSTAPFGTKGSFVATTNQTSVGPTRGQIKITITSTPSDANNLGVYQFGSLSGTPVTSGETFPSGFDKRSNIIWGITERGDVTATMVFDYSGQGGVSDASTIEILKRDDADDTSWAEVTESSRDNGAKTITLTGIITFSEYALGAKSDNSLPVVLTSFTARQENGQVILEWITESEVENLGFILEQRNLKLEIGDWGEIANYKTHAELRGQGSTTNRTEYQFTDPAVQPSLTYDYRLADVDYSGNTKYHGTRSVTIKSADQLLIPETFSLKPAYPNPFNPYTVILFALPEAAEVSMMVMDVTGKTVRVLVNNQDYPAGEFSILWNGQSNAGIHLSSGMYFLQLIAGENIRSQKIVLLR